MMPEVAAIILRRADALMIDLLDLYWDGRNLPHPYDALGIEACRVAHDYANRATGLHSLLDRIEERGRDDRAADVLGWMERFQESFDRLDDIARALPDRHADLTDRTRRIVVEARSDTSRLRSYLLAVGAVSEAPTMIEA